jgi:hypothetical protein
MNAIRITLSAGGLANGDAARAGGYFEVDSVFQDMGAGQISSGIPIFYKARPRLTLDVAYRYTFVQQKAAEDSAY